MQGEDPKYYVYTLAYPDGKVFYVGKGCGQRIDDHERVARKRYGILKNMTKVNIIREIWASGEDVLKKKLAHFETEEQAYEYESALIFFLLNLTNGGEGAIKGKDYGSQFSTIMHYGMEDDK